jgi:hypothetical protein
LTQVRSLATEASICFSGGKKVSALKKKKDHHQLRPQFVFQGEKKSASWYIFHELVLCIGVLECGGANFFFLGLVHPKRTHSKYHKRTHSRSLLITYAEPCQDICSSALRATLGVVVSSSTSMCFVPELGDDAFHCVRVYLCVCVCGCIDILMNIYSHLCNMCIVCYSTTHTHTHCYTHTHTQPTTHTHTHTHTHTRQQAVSKKEIIHTNTRRAACTASY